MSKLNELAELLKSAKRSTIQKQQQVDVSVPVVEETVSKELPDPFQELLEAETISNLPEPKPVVVAPAQEPVLVQDKPNLFMQQMQKEMQLLRKMIEESQHRQSAIYQPSYSGGGADSMTNIDRPIRNVVANYTPTTRDWYIGVGQRNEIITITLPTAIKNGREYVIKDEAGIAQLVPIRIVGTIDTDPEGIEIRINYGSVTLLYNNGWRII